MSLGENIKQLRKKMNMTQDEFAHKAGISRSYLGDLENNRRNPSTETVKKIAEKLDISLLYLLDGKPIKSDHIFFEKESIESDELSPLTNNHDVLSTILEKVDSSSFTSTQRLTLIEFFKYLSAVIESNEVETFEPLDQQLNSLIVRLRRLASKDEKAKNNHFFEELLSDIASSSVNIVKESKAIAESQNANTPIDFSKNVNFNEKGLHYLNIINELDNPSDK